MLSSLLGVWRDIGQRLRAVYRERGNVKDRSKSLVGRLKRTRGW